MSYWIFTFYIAMAYRMTKSALVMPAMRRQMLYCLPWAFMVLKKRKRAGIIMRQGMMLWVEVEKKAKTGVRRMTHSIPISPARLPKRTGKVRLPASRSESISRRLLTIKTHIEIRPHTAPARIDS